MKEIRFTENGIEKVVMIKEKDEMTYNEKAIRKAICDFRDEYVGGLENSVLDGEEFEEPISNKDVESYIYYELMCGKGNLIWTHKGLCIEKKHVKFLGSDYIKAMIRDRVAYDYNKNGWAMPCKWED